MILAVGEIGSMKEIEIALAELIHAKVSATTANGRNNRGLIFVASVHRGTCNNKGCVIGIPYAKMRSQYSQVVGYTSYASVCNKSATIP
jgi:hypothetical protein